MKNYITKVIIFVNIILLVSFGVILLNMQGLVSFSHQEEKNSTILLEKVEDLSNLATVKYNYHEIVDYSDIIKFGEMNLPFSLGGKKILITYRAYVNGGCEFIDLEEVSQDYIKVYLSKGQIFDNVLILDSVNIYDMQEGIFNKFKIIDDTSLINENMQKYLEENKEEIILSAEKNAEKILTNFLQTLGYTSIEIIFQ
ncbi:MAG: DUF4230 domain-containing protein [Peptococcales bacterium]